MDLVGYPCRIRERDQYATIANRKLDLNWQETVASSEVLSFRPLRSDDDCGPYLAAMNFQVQTPVRMRIAVLAAQGTSPY